MRISLWAASAAKLGADSRWHPVLLTILVGLLLGGSAAALGLLTVIGGPVIAFGLVIGVAAGLYVLTNLMVGLYALIAAVCLIPFGTLPFTFALTPTFIDVALVGFLLVYLFQWMTRRRTSFRFVPAQALIVAFILYCLISFVAGLGHSALTTTTLRKFVELLLSLITAVVLVDVARDVPTLRRITLALLIFGALQATIGLILYVLNDLTALRLLNLLVRFGYPGGNVLRFVEDNPDLGERAIGTWVDPNAYGGFLIMVGAMVGVQALSARPVTGRRMWAWGALALISGAILLTQSRGAWLAYGTAILFVAVLRHRWLLLVGVVGAALLLTLPFMQPYVERLAQGLGGEDRATQMRFGEYKDALTLIGRYPLLGVGFSGTPDRDIYLGVSSTYLKIANTTGLVGLALYLLIFAETLRYGLWRLRKQPATPDGLELRDLWLGFAAGVVGALVSGVVDHYYFNIEFHGVSMMLWVLVGLALASARATIQEPDRT